MSVIVVVFGMGVILMALMALMSPARLRDLILGWPSHMRFYLALVIRLGAGMLFFIAAPHTRFPLAIGILGGLMIASGILVLAMGPRRLDVMIARLLPQQDGVVRMYAVLGMLFGGLLVYAGL
ncbi:MAG: hypothetical protein IT368_01580 [Candidatus Hydrogenedentes bacterium]|nr:hypothetical protein [Candidatus Hydrogenedentota bacterium]